MVGVVPVNVDVGTSTRVAFPDGFPVVLPVVRNVEAGVEVGGNLEVGPGEVKLERPETVVDLRIVGEVPVEMGFADGRAEVLLSRERVTEMRVVGRRVVELRLAVERVVELRMMEERAVDFLEVKEPD
jgi:hypothetical protein